MPKGDKASSQYGNTKSCEGVTSNIKPRSDDNHKRARRGSKRKSRSQKMSLLTTAETQLRYCLFGKLNKCSKPSLTLRHTTVKSLSENPPTVEAVRPFRVWL